MPPHNRSLSVRQWNVCRSVFFGTTRKNHYDYCSDTFASSSFSSSALLSAFATPHPPRTRRKAERGAAFALALAPPAARATAPPCVVVGAMGLRPLSTSVWDEHAPPSNNNDTPSSQQPQPQSPSTFTTQRRRPPPLVRIDPQPPHHQPNDAGVAATGGVDPQDLAARSQYLEQVARGGREVDGRHTVRVQDYFQTVKEWMAVAKTAEEEDFPGKSISNNGNGNRRLEAARSARSLLRSLEHNWDPSQATSFVLLPPAALYETVLQVYAVCDGGIVAANEAQELLQHMLQRVRTSHGHTHPPPPEPTLHSFNIVLNCWAKAKSPDAGRRAERVLTVMEEWRSHCHKARQHDPSFPYQGCYADSTTISTLIHAWTTSQNWHAPDRAWQLLREVLDVQRNPSPAATLSDHRFHQVRLELDLFNAVISAWTRCGRGRIGAVQAEDMLSLAVTLHEEGVLETVPDQRTYALVLDAWAKCEDSTGDCAQRAHDILFNMIRLYRQGVSIEFNAVGFGACMTAWSKCANVKDAPEKAEAILQELLALHEETGLADFEPSFVVWNSLQAVWLHATNRTDSMDRCAEIIQRMQKHGCHPTIVSYGKVLHAAARRGLGTQALALLQQYAVSSNFPLYHHVRSLNNVLEALAREARDDAMDRATAFFEVMKGHENFAKPDVFSYTLLLDALSRIEGEGCRHAERGRGLLEEMIQRFQQGNESCRPDARVVFSVLKLCGCTKGTEGDRRRALDIALETYSKCESYCGVPPNHVVYNILLHAINRLASTKDQREMLLENVFEECRAGGHVSLVAVKIMRQGGSSHCLSRLTASSSRQVPHHDRPILDFVPRRGAPSG